MQAQRFGTAALVAALAVSGTASVGVAFADGHGHGATAFGGSSGVGLFQQNTAQAHKQNNSCSHQNRSFSQPLLTGSRVVSSCVTGDASFNKRTVVAGGGAHVFGGSSTASELDQQNTAQQGRQNNTCAELNALSLDLRGTWADSRCVSLDRSRNKHTVVKSRGAHASAGSGTVVATFQENTAQEGRQNSHCADGNSVSFGLTGGRAKGRCANVDGSHNKLTVVKGGGAHANGGSSTAAFGTNQNTAQEGRQNNNCADLDDTSLSMMGGRAEGRCANVDGSRNKLTVVKGGGAHANGGSSAAGVNQQNTAQEGRQNNNCADLEEASLSVMGGRAESRCTNVDGSRNKRTLVKGGGALSEGGSNMGAQLFQQNTAQEGRQNNNCAALNHPVVRLTGSREQDHCVTVDRSLNRGDVDISRGAEADGGSGLATLDQQNTAQDGRQNNNCGNSNALTLTASGSRIRTHCAAFDESKNIDSLNR